MRRHCSHLIVLAVMLVGLPTARAADEMLTLACKGTTIAGYEGAKPEPLSMGIIVNLAFRQWPASSSNAPRTLAPPGNGMPTILTWRRTAPLSVVSSGPMPRPETRLGCGHWHSASTRIEARRTAMLRAGRLRWLHLPRAGDGSDRKLRQLSEQCGHGPPHCPVHLRRY
jgi:hypothetical protein